jgi:hypothetical protein
MEAAPGNVVDVQVQIAPLFISLPSVDVIHSFYEVPLSELIAQGEFVLKSEAVSTTASRTMSMRSSVVCLLRSPRSVRRSISRSQQ